MRFGDRDEVVGTLGKPPRVSGVKGVNSRSVFHPEDFVFCLRSLSIFFIDGDRRITALSDVSIDVPSGSVVGILGESGSGKSTMLNILGGFMKPDRGQLTFYDPVGGHHIALQYDDPAFMRSYWNSRIGCVWQHLNLVSCDTVIQNVCIPLEMRGLDRANMREQSAGLLKTLGIEKLADRYPRTLSGGEKQRVAVARALAANAQVILADEPTGNLDRENTTRVFELLVEVNQTRKVSVIVVTHDERNAAQYCNHLFLCSKTNNGNVVRKVQSKGR